MSCIGFDVLELLSLLRETLYQLEENNRNDFAPFINKAKLLNNTYQNGADAITFRDCLQNIHSQLDTMISKSYLSDEQKQIIIHAKLQLTL